MSKLLKILMTGAFVAVLALGTVACEDNDGPMEEAGEKIDDAVEEVGDGIEDATD